MSTEGTDVTDIGHAAKELEKTLRGEPWLVAVGVFASATAKRLLVYVSKKPPKGAVPDTWLGFPVQITPSGKIKPVTTPRMRK